MTPKGAPQRGLPPCLPTPSSPQQPQANRVEPLDQALRPLVPGGEGVENGQTAPLQASTQHSLAPCNQLVTYPVGFFSPTNLVKHVVNIDYGLFTHNSCPLLHHGAGHLPPRGVGQAQSLLANPRVGVILTTAYLAKKVNKSRCIEETDHHST